MQHSIYIASYNCNRNLNGSLPWLLLTFLYTSGVIPKVSTLILSQKILSAWETMVVIAAMAWAVSATADADVDPNIWHLPPWPSCIPWTMSAYNARLIKLSWYLSHYRLCMTFTRNTTGDNRDVSTPLPSPRRYYRHQHYHQSPSSPTQICISNSIRGCKESPDNWYCA